MLKPVPNSQLLPESSQITKKISSSLIDVQTSENVEIVTLTTEQEINNLQLQTEEETVAIEDTSEDREANAPEDMNEEINDENNNENVSESGTRNLIKMKRFSCSKCGDMFFKKRYALQHCKPKKSWICPNCFTDIVHVQNIKRHTEKCNKPKSPITMRPATEFKCESCSKVFSSKFNLVRHQIKTHKLFEPRTIVCDAKTCPFRTNDAKQLLRHKTINHSAKKTDFRCAQCDCEFLTPSGLKKHVLTIHRLDCKHCLESFATEKRLRQHTMRVHSNPARPVDENSVRAEIVVSRVIGQHAQHAFNTTAEPE